MQGMAVHELVIPVNAQGNIYEGFLSLPHGRAADSPGWGHSTTGSHQHLWFRVTCPCTSGVGTGPDHVASYHSSNNCSTSAAAAGLGCSTAGPSGQTADAAQPASGASTLAGAVLECGPEMRELLAGQEALVAQRLASSTSLHSFLSELQELLERVQSHRHASAAPPSAFYGRLVSELDALGWDHVVQLSQDCRTLVLQAHDVAGRSHLLRLELPQDYPAHPPLASAELPEPLQLGQWQANSHSLSTVMQMFHQALQQHQDTWDCLEDLDANTWVLEPAAPSNPLVHTEAQHQAAAERRMLRPGMFRRIALGGHCSLAIKLDPLAPRKPPLEVSFLGAPAAIGPLQQRLMTSMHLWSETRWPRENLQELLGTSFPLPQHAMSQQATDDISADCAICYAYHLPDPQHPDQPGEVPGEICGGPNCGRPYHRRCLAEWLRALDNTTTSFNTMFGPCPYCSTTISVRLQ